MTEGRAHRLRNARILRAPSRQRARRIRFASWLAKLPRPWRTALTVLVTVMLSTGVVAAGLTQGFPAQQPYVLSAAAWLASRAIGAVTLVDGASAEVAAMVRVAAPGTGFTVVQQGQSGYVVDPAGAVTQVDGATHTTRSLAALPAGSGEPQVFAGRAGAFLVDGVRSLVRSIDPESLETRDEWPAPDGVQAAVTGDGSDLWVLGRDGTVTRFRPGATPSQVRLGLNRFDPAHPPQLVVSGSGPVVVDPEEGRMHVLSPDGTEVTARMTARMRPDVLASADASAGWLLLVRPADATVVRCDVTARSCRDPLSLRAAEPGATNDGMGPATVLGRHAFVPDYRAGVVRIVDLDDDATVSTTTVVVPGTRFELFAANGVVFANDPNGPDAAIIAPDGTVRRVAKYSPPRPTATAATPTRSTTSEPTSGPRPTTPSAAPPATDPNPVPSTPDPTRPPSPGPTRTNPRPDPTRTTPRPAPTRTATTGPPSNPYLPRHGRLVLDDRNAGDWAQWRNYRPENGTCEYASNGYHVAANDHYHECYREFTVREFTYEVEFSFGTAKVAGIFFRQSGDGKWYWARVARSGNVVIGVGANGSDQHLFAGSVPEPDPNRWHRLAVTGVGSRLTVYVDGERVGAVSDGTYTEGPIGVFTDGGRPDGSPDGEAIFRRARVWIP